MNGPAEFEVLKLSRRHSRQQLDEIKTLMKRPDIKVVDIRRNQDQLVIVFRRRGLVSH